MPELPEVETVKRGLEEFIINETIRKVYLSELKLRFPWPKNFISEVVGKKIVSIKRRAKYIIISLNQGYSIIAHLGMSGSCLLYTSPSPRDQRGSRMPSSA